MPVYSLDETLEPGVTRIFHEQVTQDCAINAHKKFFDVALETPDRIMSTSTEPSYLLLRIFDRAVRATFDPAGKA